MIKNTIYDFFVNNKKQEQNANLGEDILSSDISLILLSLWLIVVVVEEEEFVIKMKAVQPKQ
jgi:hypothetical protein